MITLSNEVRDRLRSSGAPVWYFYPAGWSQLPVISWRESMNREYAQADGHEHLAELEYTVDVWSDSPAQCRELADEIDERLAELRLKRQFAADLFDASANMHHRSLRYRCVCDSAGNIYQS